MDSHTAVVDAEKGTVSSASCAPSALREWERAEIARSGVEATLKQRRPARATGRRIFARYASPPADTPYPWEYAFHLLGPATGARVLDLGCGDGEATTLVASHGARVVALDISRDLLTVARHRWALDGFAARVAPICASAHALPVDDRSVDVVFGMAILHHVDLRTVAREIYRVLKPGGRGIFAEPMRNSRVLAATRRLIPYRAPDVSPFERPLTWPEIRAFAAGFAAFRSRTFDLPFVQLLRLCGAPRGLQRWSADASAALLRRWPVLDRYASAIVFEVRK